MCETLTWRGDSVWAARGVVADREMCRARSRRPVDDVYGSFVDELN